jgi:hypothetical protein
VKNNIDQMRPICVNTPKEIQNICIAGLSSGAGSGATGGDFPPDLSTAANWIFSQLKNVTNGNTFPTASFSPMAEKGYQFFDYLCGYSRWTIRSTQLGSKNR